MWLSGEIKTPPFGADARLEAGFLLRQLQQGAVLSMPDSRPMTTVGPGCHELRLPDQRRDWRIMYFVAADAIVVLAVFEKKTRQTPKAILDACRRRRREYEATR